MKDEVRKKITAINRQDIKKYIAEAERSKNGFIKDHFVRLFDSQMKQNDELRQRNAELMHQCQEWRFENQVLRTEIDRLKGILGERDFKIVK